MKAHFKEVDLSISAPTNSTRFQMLLKGAGRSTEPTSWNCARFSIIIRILYGRFAFCELRLSRQMLFDRHRLARAAIGAVAAKANFVRRLDIEAPLSAVLLSARK